MDRCPLHGNPPQSRATRAFLRGLNNEAGTGWFHAGAWLSELGEEALLDNEGLSIHTGIWGSRAP